MKKLLPALLSIQRMTNWAALVTAVALAPSLVQAEPILPLNMPANSLALPVVGSRKLRLLSPTVLEVEAVTTKEPEPARPGSWDFVKEDFRLELPPASQFRVIVNGEPAAIARLGFKRRPIYAPLATRDLRIGNHLYLQLGAPIPDAAKVVVQNSSGELWQKDLEATAHRVRLSPAIHVNQVGYAPSGPKRALVGFYLGNLGELDVPEASFTVLEAATGREFHKGPMRLRRDEGYSFPAYQKVYEADFSAIRAPGEYVLFVPGLGVSLPFRIHDGAAAAYARALALGIYHQRCGGANALPFTRFTHGACHAAMAEVPTMEFKQTQQFLAGTSSEASKNPRHTAPPLKDVESSLYPFARKGKVDVSGGHHDAGDYSKYTINSASFIHHLTFAADAAPAAAALDNLGIPESGNGKSDLLELAKWEADFLVKMQDEDGGFYFLVYPRERKYEDNVLPDKGDPQIVYPKTTAATAAAVGALAQMASSPAFKRQFPDAAKHYGAAAIRGWKFLREAIAKYGRDGSYQRITHYGDAFMHDDELAWAAVEIYLLTGDRDAHTDLLAHFNPSDSAALRWGWWRLFEGFGNAARSYAFSVRTGRVSADKLDPGLIENCEDEIRKAGADIAAAAAGSAYGTSLPRESKRHRSAGWYFSLDRAFDAAAARFIEPRPEFHEAVWSNANYEGGANPQNLAFITGLGWKWQREIVHQYAQNDRRILPPSGIPIGNLQEGFAYLERYKRELGQLTFPFDGAPEPFAPYDRWADSFNVATEFVVVNQARMLAVAAWLMAESPLRSQNWRAAAARIAGLPKLSRSGEIVMPTLEGENDILTEAQIVWEARLQEPMLGLQPAFVPQQAGPFWVEAEASLPDGRRLFAVAETQIAARDGAKPAKADANTRLLLQFDDLRAASTQDFARSMQETHAAKIAGTPRAGNENLGWMETPAGNALELKSFDDAVEIPLMTKTIDPTSFSLSVRMWVDAFPWGKLTTPLVALTRKDEIIVGLRMDKWLRPAAPMVQSGQAVLVSNKEMSEVFTISEWQLVEMTVNRGTLMVRVNGKLRSTVKLPQGALIPAVGEEGVTLDVGNFIGFADEIRLASPATD